MTQPMATFETADEALEYMQANESGTPFLVLAPEVMDQIRAAEEAGGFEGGMSAGDDGGYSAVGDSGPASSDGSELPHLDFDIEGAWTSGGIIHFFQGVGEVAAGVVEAAHWIAERGITPIIVIPIEELRKLAGVPDEA